MWQPIITAVAGILAAIPGGVAAWWAWRNNVHLKNGHAHAHNPPLGDT